MNYKKDYGITQRWIEGERDEKRRSLCVNTIYGHPLLLGNMKRKCLDLLMKDKSYVANRKTYFCVEKKGSMFMLFVWQYL